MKILHVTKKYPKALGGDAVVVSSLQRHQEVAGHRVSVLTSNCEEVLDGPHVHKFGLPDTPEALDQIGLKRLISLLGLSLKAFATLSKERPDVIHTHSVDMAFFVSFAARLFGIPLVHTFHIVTFYDEKQSVFRRRTELWLAKASGARVITAPNAHDVAALNRAGFKQAVVLHNGVDLAFWRPANGKNPKSARHKEFVFMSFGRLEPQKGYEYLITAAASLKNTHAPPFRVMIAGDGGQKAALQGLARRLGVEDIVVFLGRKTPEEIRELLWQADAAVFASLYETTPLTLLEAWAVGIPVIMTAVGILQNAPQDMPEAYRVRPGEERSLLAAMESCMTNTAKRIQVATAGHKAAAKYGWTDIAQTVETLYRGTS